MSKFFREINYLPEVKINKKNKSSRLKNYLLSSLELFLKEHPEHRQKLEPLILKHSRKIVHFMEKSDFIDMTDEKNLKINVIFMFYLFLVIVRPPAEWSEDFLNDLTIQFFRYGGHNLFRFTLQLVDEPGKKILAGYFARWQEIVLNYINEDYKNRKVQNLLLLNQDEDDE